MSFRFKYLGLDGKILVTDFALRATASLRIAVFASSDGITKDCCLLLEAEERLTIHIGVPELIQVWYPWTFELELSSELSASIGRIGHN